MNKTLESIPEYIEDNIEHDDNNDNKLYVEITYYFDNLPYIKSYYIMTDEEYKKLTLLHIDIYIENFINNETLTKDKLDIHVINNPYNIKVINEFLNLYGNPFDLLHLINIKKSQIIKDLINNDFENNSNEDDSDELVSSITDIINSFNKTNIINNDKILEISKCHPEILCDDVIKDFI